MPTPSSVPASHPSPQPATADLGWLRCKLTAELLEDSHFGSGSGGAGIDALVARDRDGRPVIWASHIEGVLRDILRRSQGAASAEAFFGAAGGRRQPFVLSSLYCAESPSMRVWRSAARAAFDNRAPKDDTLRAIEYVPAGTKFHGEIEVRLEHFALLQRLIAELDALGHGRASGDGQLRLQLVPSRPAPRNLEGSPETRLLLLLRNLDPISITATANPTNIIPTFAYIPGRALLGSMADWLLSENQAAAAELLVSGKTSVGDALPLPSQPANLDGVAVSPAPLSLRSKKPAGASGGVPWWVREPGPVHRVDRRLAETPDGHGAPELKRPEADLFVCRLGGSSSWLSYRPTLRVRLRNGRPDPDQSDPSLFAIEQIAERALFLAEVQGAAADLAALAAALAPVLEGRRWLRIGRGGAPIEVLRAQWAGAPEPKRFEVPACLTLTSDLLARDELLRWLTALDGDNLQAIAGWSDGAVAEVVDQDSVPVHGFNGTSRLWRQPAVAIRRGSVLLVQPGAANQLAVAEAAGHWLGERTHEGFGRFRLDESLPGVAPPPAPAALTFAAGAPDDSEEPVAAATHDWFTEYQAQTGAGGQSPPSLSQWLDLVSDLDRAHPDAIASRLKPQTAGKRSWKHPGAVIILNKIQSLPVPDRAAHARMFVRWLRADARRRRS